MRPFEDLVEEIEVNGVKFIPIVEIANLAEDGFPPDSIEYFFLASITRGVIPTINYTSSRNRKKQLCVFKDFSLSLMYLKTGENAFIHRQLRIFQKLHEWGFIEMPGKPMPTDEEIESYFDTTNLKQSRYAIFRQALQHFMGVV